LNAEPSALPKFVDNEAWYLHVSDVSMHTFTRTKY
jgi:hypothetical protein